MRQTGAPFYAFAAHVLPGVDRREIRHQVNGMRGYYAVRNESHRCVACARVFNPMVAPASISLKHLRSKV
jgi:hypothetical protein